MKATKTAADAEKAAGTPRARAEKERTVKRPTKRVPQRDGLAKFARSVKVIG